METDFDSKQEIASSILDQVNQLSDMVSNIGRRIVFTIIAGVWVLSYSNNIFAPTKLIIWSIALSFLYLFLDLIYYIVRMWVSNSWLKNDFYGLRLNPKNNLYESLSKSLSRWHLFSLWFTTFKTLILVASALLIFIHIISM